MRQTRQGEVPFDVMHVDEAVVVVNKPPGVVVHPAAGHEEHTLVNALLHHCAGQLSGIGGRNCPSGSCGMFSCVPLIPACFST